MFASRHVKPMLVSCTLVLSLTLLVLTSSLPAIHAHPNTAEIVLFDGHVVVYKYLGDLMFYVTGSQDENELVLTTVLTAFYEAVSILLR